ncbi:MAG: RsmD family RNA methyltransferase [Methanoregula sp.]|nr:RsmD family RNA methyltransferase [Methanoregula sp.]
MRLKDQLAEILPAEVLPYVSNRFEVIGDIAVIAVPAGLDPWKHKIAQAIVSRRKNLATVLNKKEKVAGGSRTARYEVLWGVRTTTVHRESGFAYCLDVGGAFFSTRMASERKRVTGQTGPGERVYIPFAGVGPFVIPAAARGAEVYAMENNPDAFRYLLKNADLNHVTAHCHLLQGDAFDTAPFTGKVFDRLIIPAPYGMDNAPGVLLPLLSRGGRVHFYTFKAKEQIPGLIAAFKGKGLTVTYSSPCGNVAPGISRWVFDMTRTPRQ